MRLDRPRSNLTAGSAALLSAIGGEAPSWRRLLTRLKLHFGLFRRVADLVPSGATVLDVGCGFGVLLGWLAVCGRPIRGLGFDRGASEIREAQRMAARLETLGSQAELRFECRDIGDSWPPGAFDVVTIIDVLHHLPIAQRRRLLEEAAERLRPGGLLVLKDISPRPLWRAYANRLTDLVLHRSWVSYTSPEEIISWGEDSGFQVVTCERTDRLWYGHTLLVFRRLDDAARSREGDGAQIP